MALHGETGDFIIPAFTLFRGRRQKFFSLSRKKHLSKPQNNQQIKLANQAFLLHRPAAYAGFNDMGEGTCSACLVLKPIGREHED